MQRTPGAGATHDRIRRLAAEDHDVIAPRVDAWWGGRPVRGLLPRVVFEHLDATSLAICNGASVQAFLIGFPSQGLANAAYIHVVGVDPACRSLGFGRALHDRFFDLVAALGCTEVHCVTAPVNRGPIAFHRRMGFESRPGTGEIDGIPVMLDHAGEGQHRVRWRKRL